MTRGVSKEQSFANPENYRLAKNALLILRDTLDGLGCQWWLAGGTLLGCMRENDLIPHDEDIDIWILAANEQHKQKIRGAIRAKRFSWLATKEDGVAYAVPGTDDWKVHVDIYFAEVTGSHIRIKLMGHGHDHMWLPMFERLIRVKMWGTDFPVPQNWEEQLVAQYGEKWRKPVANYLYTDSWNFE